MGMPRVGFDLADGRVLSARFTPPLTENELETLLTRLDQLQWTEPVITTAIRDFARGRGFEVVTTIFPGDKPT